MTFTDAQPLAAAADLVAVERWGWCILHPDQGGAFVSRGGSWRECLERAGLMPGQERVEVEPQRPAGSLFEWAQGQE